MSWNRGCSIAPSQGCQLCLHWSPLSLLMCWGSEFNKQGKQVLFPNSEIGDRKMGAWLNLVESLQFSGKKSEGREGCFESGRDLLCSPFQLCCSSQFYLEQKSAKILVTVALCWQHSFPALLKYRVACALGKILAINLKMFIASHRLFLSGFRRCILCVL